MTQEWAVYKYAWLGAADTPRVGGVEIRFVGACADVLRRKVNADLGCLPAIYCRSS